MTLVPGSAGYLAELASYLLWLESLVAEVISRFSDLQVAWPLG